MNSESTLGFDVPQGWTPIPRQETHVKNGVTFEGALVYGTACDGFVPNIVLLSSDHAELPMSEWIEASLADLVQSVPGLYIVDQQPWASDSLGGLFVCGTYLMEDVNVTLMRWILVGEKRSVSIDATIPSKQVKALTNDVFTFAESCQEL